MSQAYQNRKKAERQRRRASLLSDPELGDVAREVLKGNYPKHTFRALDEGYPNQVKLLKKAFNLDKSKATPILRDHRRFGKLEREEKGKLTWATETQINKFKRLLKGD